MCTTALRRIIPALIEGQAFRVQSALSDQRTGGNDLNENDLPACLTVRPSLVRLGIHPLWVGQRNEGPQRMDGSEWKRISFVAEVKKKKALWLWETLLHRLIHMSRLTTAKVTHSKDYGSVWCACKKTGTHKCTKCSYIITWTWAWAHKGNTGT